MLGMIVKGSNLTITIDGFAAQAFTDTAIASGKAGASIFSALPGTTISNLKIGAMDTTAPGVVNGGAVAVTAVPSRVEMQWPAVLDDPGGSRDMKSRAGESCWDGVRGHSLPTRR